MNSTPKQQEGDGASAAAANGSRSALEQTVLGVAPTAATPSERAEAPNATAGATPSEPTAHSTTKEPPAVAATPVIVAAPTIAVSGSAPAAPPEQRVAAPAAATPAAVDLVPSRELPAEPSAPVVVPPERASATPPYGTPAAGNTEGQQSTVLNSDYLRVAREVAFAQAAPSSGAPPEPAPAASAHASDPGTVEDLGGAASLRPSWATSTTTAGVSTTLGGATIRGFEPVPPVRAPLAESLSGGLMVPDLGARTLPRGPRPLPRPGGSQRGDSKGRWMLLCAVAFATVGVVSFGGRLLNRYRSTTERTRALAAVEVAPPAAPGGDAPGSETPVRDPREGDGPGAGAASRALLANRPAPERGSAAGRTTVVSASGSSAVAAGGAADVVSGGAANAPGSLDVASQESQLAATAARHMLAGSYAEALPVYRQLAREWPENSSYAAMARLLEKRVGTVNDTRTIAPAAP